jgi:hypothetical protein
MHCSFRKKGAAWILGQEGALSTAVNLWRQKKVLCCVTEYALWKYGWRPFSEGTGKLKFGKMYGPQRAFVKVDSEAA